MVFIFKRKVLFLLCIGLAFFPRAVTSQTVYIHLYKRLYEREFREEIGEHRELEFTQQDLMNLTVKELKKEILKKIGYHHLAVEGKGLAHVDLYQQGHNTDFVLKGDEEKLMKSSFFIINLVFPGDKFMVGGAGFSEDTIFFLYGSRGTASDSGSKGVAKKKVESPLKKKKTTPKKAQNVLKREGGGPQPKEATPSNESRNVKKLPQKKPQQVAIEKAGRQEEKQLKGRGVLKYFIVAALLLSSSWGLYVYAKKKKFVKEEEEEEEEEELFI